MNQRNWILLVLTLLLVGVAPVAQFLPGFGNFFFHAISQFARAIGYIGLPFLPFGLIWLFIELRNRKGQLLNLWTNGYYPSWLAMIPVFIFSLFKFVTTFLEGQAINLLPFAIIALVTTLFIIRIQKLKNKTAYKFNVAPLYLVCIPLVALLSSGFAVEKAAFLTRESAITRTAPLIDAIEQYKKENGVYPESLETLPGNYFHQASESGTMLLNNYQYRKQSDSFQLSFERVWHWNATEVVVYNAIGQDAISGNYENHPTNHKNWCYYMAD